MMSLDFGTMGDPNGNEKDRPRRRSRSDGSLI
jgi:hypothetical protein